MNVTGRAFTLLDVKSVSEADRVIEGIASTPRPDRVGDVVESLGASYALPMPLLLDHNHLQQVGHVEFAKATKDGITFRARIAKITEPGPAKDLVDGAWQLVKHKLRAAVSIGFRPLDNGYERMKSGGLRFTAWEWLELSLVSVPAQSDAVIFQAKSLGDAAVRALKQFDIGAPAATGQNGSGVNTPKLPGATGTPNHTTKGARPVATIAEQIAAFEAKRQAKAARMDEIMTKANEEGTTLDAAQEEEYDGLADEVASIDKHLGRLAVQEKTMAARARPVTDVKSAPAAAAARSGIVVTAQKEAPGIQFARVVKCLGMADGNRREALEIAKERYGSDNDVSLALKAAVSAGHTGAGSWTENLVGAETAVFADFVEFLRPQTILGRFGQGGIPALRRVPFRTPLVGQTGGGEGYWVGEGAAKPLTSFAFNRTTLEPLKVANIAVLTMETIRSSAPAADGIVRDQLAAALASRLDIDFINPAKAAGAASPASVTNGAFTAASAGPTADDMRADIRTVYGHFIANQNAPTSGVWIMSATTALAISMMVNPLGQAEFPGLTMQGGVFNGLPVIVSEHVGNVVALVNAQDIYLGDEGGVRVDMSTQASLEMSNTPTGSSVTPTASTLVSLWQTNSVGFLAEREINWARRRPASVAYLTGVTWGGPAPATP